MVTPPILYFELRRDGAPARFERTTLSLIKIGSHPASHIRVDDPDVSRVHAVVEKDAAGVFVIDLGFGRGTFVNGERVTKQAIRHGDVVRVGQTELVVRHYDEAAVAEAARRRRLAIDPRTNRPRDEVLYSRRFLAKPRQTDGAVEIAMLYRDFVMAEELYRPSRSITVGSDTTQADFVVDHPAVGARFTLVDSSGAEPVLNFVAGMAGELYIGSQRMTLQEAHGSPHVRRNGLVSSVPLRAETRAKIVLGDIKLFVHRSTQPRVHLPHTRRNAAPVMSVGFSAALHGMFLALLLLLPPGISALALDSFATSGRHVHVMFQEPEPEPETPDEEPGDQADARAVPDNDSGSSDGRPSAEPATAESAAARRLPPSDMPDELGSEPAAESIQSRGALPALNHLPDGIASVFGNAVDSGEALRAIEGVGAHYRYGSNGLAQFNGGLRGDGRHTGRLRQGGPRGLSDRGRSDDVRRVLSNVGEDRPRLAAPVRTDGDPVVFGQIDRGIIQRVIREHRREIRTCYESELQRDHSLEGRMVVAFVISSDGTVAGSRISDSTLGNSTVEECVAGRVRQWRFPAPDGGGSVNVSYPFVFGLGG